MRQAYPALTALNEIETGVLFIKIYESIMHTFDYSNNPLLDFSGLPRFAEFRPELVTPAVDRLLQHNRETVERLLADTAAPAWDNFVQPLDDANEKTARAWGQVSHLNAVMNICSASAAVRLLQTMLMR